MKAESSITLNIKGNIDDLESKLKSLQGSLNNLAVNSGDNSITKSFNAILDKLEAIRDKTNKPINSEKAFGSIKSDLDDLVDLYNKLDKSAKTLANDTKGKNLSILPANSIKNIQAAIKGLEDYNKTIAQTKEKSADYTKTANALAKAQSELATKQTIAKAAVDAYNDAVKKSNDLQRQRDAAKNDPNATPEQIAQLVEESKAASQYVSDMRESMNSANKSVQELQNKIKGLTTTLAEYDKTAKAEGTKQRKKAFEDLITLAQKLGISLDGLATNTDGSLSQTASNVKELQNRLNEFINSGETEAIAKTKELSSAFEELNIQTENVKKTTEDTNDAFNTQNETIGQVQGITNRIKQFTGLAGAAYLLRRAVHGAFESIKELDEQMTQMAVVTDLSVGDYWKQLPEHTERANALGMAIKDVYEAETLYYQQGLKTAEVTQLSTSTLKMARIASLSAEDATNKMTAALRGFNMEITQTNADRVADVYSKLAAITASDVEEISTAMTKTASIASSAGMEFETTAAFLSQIIETTRESAETAGTALKTVIARFQELKKSPSEIGEVEGEIIDANKIETALRSVGVALRDEIGQFRNLDDVFLELASKWDTLDMNTQRYIATIAAGSRQQSRFVAMMSNYARTQELVNAANNAAGASNEQFEKTLDSLQSKLAALRNAWDTFTMSLANNELIKGAVDLLTNLINTINKISDAFGEKGGIAFKIGLIAVALKAGDFALKTFLTDFQKSRSIISGVTKIGTEGFSKIKGSIQTNIDALKKYKLVVKDVNTTGLVPQQTLKNLQNLEDEYLKVNRAFYQNKAGLSDVNTAYNNLTGTMNTLGIATNMTETQQAAFNKALQNSLPIEQALTIATNEEAAAKYLNTEATDTLTISQAIQQTTEKKGLLYTIKNVALLLFGNKLMRQKAGAALGLASAEQIEAMSTEEASSAQMKLNAAMYASPIGWIALAIMAAVAALTIFIALCVKFGKEASFEGRLKALSERLTQVSEAADEAKEELESIEDSKNSYESIQGELDTLVEGTQEWTSALIKANGQVLDLVNKYAVLSKYIKNTNGRLTIDSRGWDELISQQQRIVMQYQDSMAGIQATISAVTDAQNTAKLYNKLDAFQAEEAVQNSAFQDAITSIIPSFGTLNFATRLLSKEFFKFSEDWGVWGSVFRGGIKSFIDPVSVLLGPLGLFKNVITDINATERESRYHENLHDMAYEFLKQGLTFEEKDKAAIQELYKEIFNENMTDDFYESLKENQEEFTQLGISIENTRQKMDNYAQSITANALALAGVKTNNEWYNALQGFGSTALNGSNIEDLKNELIEGIKEGTVSYSQLLEEYANLTGQFYRNDKIYKTGNLAEQNEDTEVKVDQANVAQLIAENQLRKEQMSLLSKAAVQLENAALNMNDSEKMRLKRILSNDARNLTNADIKAVSDAGGISNWLAKNGIELDLSDESIKSLNETLTFSETDIQRRNTALAQGQNITLNNAEGLTNYLTGKQITALDEALGQVSERLGTNATKALVDAMKSTSNQLAELGGQDLVELFQSQLTSIDWSSAESITTFTDNLDALVSLSDEERAIVEQWTQSLIGFAGALYAIDLDSMRNSLSALNAVIEKLSETTRDFTEEEYSAFIKAGVASERFIQTLDGWRYVGSVSDMQRELAKTTAEQQEKIIHNLQTTLGSLGKASDQLVNDQEKLDEFLNKTQKIDSWQALGEWLIDLIKQIGNLLKPIGDWILTSIKDALTKMVEFYQKIQEFKQQVKDAIQEVKDAIENFFNLFTEAFYKLGDTLIEKMNKWIREFNEKSPRWFKLNEITTERKNESEDPGYQKATREDQERATKLAKEYVDEATQLSQIVQTNADTADVGYILESGSHLKDNLAAIQTELDKATDATIKNAYQTALDSTNEALTKFDQALVSKGLGYEDLIDEAKRFQYALENDSDAADELRIKLANALKTADAKKMLKTTISALSKGFEEYDKLEGNVAAQQNLLERMSGQIADIFSGDVDTAFKFLINNLETVRAVTEGNLDAWEEFQEEIASARGLKIDLTADINANYDAINKELEKVVKTSEEDGQKILNNLLDSGAFKMREIVAKSTMQIPMIDYSSGYPTMKGMQQVTAGSTYWQLVPSDAADLSIVTEELGSAKQEEMWKNPYTWLDNAKSAAEANQRQRERLERYWGYYNEDDASYGTFKSNIEARKANIDRAEKGFARMREDTISSLQEALDKLASEGILQGYNSEDVVTVGANGAIEINHKFLDSLKILEDEGKILEEDVSAIQGWVDELVDIEENQWDLVDLKRELAKTGKDQYKSLLDETVTALVNKYQKEIDIMSTINDTIKDAQAALVDKMQEKIDDDRNARELAKAEEDLANKQMRLSYLQASGGSALDILQLQKEIADDQQSLEDTYIDNSIDALTRANDAAAEQRQKQIDIAQEQLNWWKDHDAQQYAEGLLDKSLAEVREGQKFTDTEVGKLLDEDSGVKYMSKMGTEDWNKEHNISGTLAALYNKEFDEGTTYHTAGEAGKKNDTLYMSGNNKTPKKKEEGGNGSGSGNGSGNGSSDGNGDENVIRSQIQEEWLRAAKESDFNFNRNAVYYAEGETDEVGRQLYHYNLGPNRLTATSIEQLEALVKQLKAQWLLAHSTTTYAGSTKKVLQKYASGGLANFTGPAWLDGSFANPELVLNATDTANFIQLKNILADIMRGAHDRSSDKTDIEGNNYYDIDVHVDSIDNDYGIDQAVDRLRNLIEADAMYRNVNAVELIR